MLCKGFSSARNTIPTQNPMSILNMASLSMNIDCGPHRTLEAHLGHGFVKLGELAGQAGDFLEALSSACFCKTTGYYTPK